MDSLNMYEYYLWDQIDRESPEERLQSAASAACRAYRLTRDTSCRPVFYPYVGLKNTIKIEEDCTRIRISDILRDAPYEVLEALVHILVARATGKKPSDQYLKLYSDYTGRPEVEARHARARRSRARKILPGPVGCIYNLNDSFQRVNHRYFDDSFTPPTLSWSPTRSRRQLGYHDAHLHLVVISRWLDRKNVPVDVLDYIMYHELLHIAVKPEMREGKRIVHTREFQRREKQFDHYEAAIRWLKRA